MKKHTKLAISASLAIGAAVLAGCAATSPKQDLDAEFKAMLQSSFSARGIAKMDRLDQDLGQSACSSAKQPPEAVLKQIEAEALATLKWPDGGQYFGDWKRAEKLAQSGVGMAWNNKSVDPKTNGGQCYNCHQIDKKEISFGTIGPSLWNYGKVRGVKDVTDPAAAPIIQYTWGKLWNSKAYSGCSNMPRFGHMNMLDQGQLRDLMSLLLDPRSPVNQ
ncbi:MAG: sulfur oxidation c-type cytochrome SoxX [Burkholderiales bacterium RIFCSPHIGHO2_12_FULL_69_20]|nr:MAG: sulfur oxidation c-type cytochrome SoxX [Burkholderiales bacterium RIFCSPHIGHO2_12_FULL_69_20]